jgi:DNA replication and repair protein RecF
MIADIRLQHFRSYTDEVFEFTPAVNIIVGPNGSGKTNLLEAVLVVARGSSYRVKDAELVQYDQPWARLDAHVLVTPGDFPVSGESVADTRTVKIVNEPTLGKSYEIEGKKYLRLNAAKMIPSVMFEPNHLMMLTGSPELRRSYLDDLLEQIEPGYAKLKRDYKRTLAQRNALLKRQGIAAQSSIFPWNIRLSELGGAIAEGRIGLLESLNKRSSELYSSLADKESTVELVYETKFSPAHYASSLLKSLEHNFELDVMRGFTGNGPHREDMTVIINSHPSASSASRGETRTAVLMLKVMELQLIEQARGEKPLLLLDDVFSELDGNRRQALTTYLQDYQTFITTTDADVVVQHFMDRCTIIPLSINRSYRST